MDLLQQNAQAFSQISYNLSVCKDNISLFDQTRNNISAILTNMKEMPGIMSRMSALPVTVNDDLASHLLSSTTQGKRRKRKENSAGNNVYNRKVVDTSPELSMLANVPQQNALYVMNNMCHSTHMPREVMDLLQQNAQAFSQISYNLSVCKLQDNISLFDQTRNNISAILTNMKEMPGIMSRMSALPVTVNDDLASHLLSSTTQVKSLLFSWVKVLWCYLTELLIGLEKVKLTKVYALPFTSNNQSFMTLVELKCSIVEQSLSPCFCVEEL
ncbi:hypothetical protein F2Q70_00041882 [Brassica cretica]|uniref:Uncharacterized protein n=1 Tax=Brassica cretica TaxID=69181 RepID=A0A8S9K637_BRACR|nr:hypothetical protein F2Q70_00041882 [Brassica cretica]